VDRSLQNAFPAGSTAPVQQILADNTTDASVEALAVENAKGTITVMVVNRAVHADSDDNGSGDARTVVVDLSSFNQFAAASLKSVDATTNLVSGPVGTSIPPSSRITVTFAGYGVAFLTLMP